MKETNKEIRKAVIMHDLTMYKLAELLNISEATLYRKLRHELPAEEKESILQTIQKEGK